MVCSEIFRVFKIDCQAFPQRTGFGFKGRHALDQTEVVKGLKLGDEFVQQVYQMAVVAGFLGWVQSRQPRSHTSAAS